MSYRLSYLENFRFSNFHHPASEAANKLYPKLETPQYEQLGGLQFNKARAIWSNDDVARTLDYLKYLSKYWPSGHLFLVGFWLHKTFFKELKRGFLKSIYIFLQQVIRSLGDTIVWPHGLHLYLLGKITNSSSLPKRMYFLFWKKTITF